MQRVFWCECGQKMRVSEKMLGRSGKCVKCGRIVTVTEANTEPAEEKPRRPEPTVEPRTPVNVPTPPPPPRVASASDAGSDLSDAPDFEELLVTEDADSEYETFDEAVPAAAPPPPPPPPRLRSRAPVAAVEASDFDMLLRAANAVLDWRKLGMTMVLLFLEVIGAALVCTTALVHIGLAITLVILWALACGGVITGGIAHLVNVELTEHRRPKAAEGWRFIGGRLGELLLVLSGVSVGTLVVAAVGNGFVYLVAKLPGIGGLLSALLLIPLFVFNLLVVFILANMFMVPCIMAVENCGASEAARRLVRLLTKRAGHVIASGLMAFSLMGPMIFVLVLSITVAYLLTLLVSVAPVAGAQAFANDPVAALVGSEGMGARLALFCAVIVYWCCLSIVPVVGAAGLTVAYKWVSRREWE